MGTKLRLVRCLGCADLETMREQREAILRITWRVIAQAESRGAFLAVEKERLRQMLRDVE